MNCLGAEQRIHVLQTLDFSSRTPLKRRGYQGTSASRNGSAMRHRQCGSDVWMTHSTRAVWREQLNATCWPDTDREGPLLVNWRTTNLDYNNKGQRSVLACILAGFKSRCICRQSCSTRNATTVSDDDARLMPATGWDRWPALQDSRSERMQSDAASARAEPSSVHEPIAAARCCGVGDGSLGGRRRM